MTILNDKFTGKWSIEQGVIPTNQTLEPLDEKLGILLEEE